MKKPIRIFLRPGMVVVLLVISGCVSMANIRPHSTLLKSDSLLLKQTNPHPYRISSWWKRYHQPALDSLIKQAIEHTPSLKAAQARVRQAEAMTQLASAAGGPAIDFNANMTRRYLSAYGQVPLPLGGALSSLYETGLSFRYIFDVWGQARAQIAAALSEKAALQIEADEARRVLSLAISSRYFQYQALQIDMALLSQLTQTRQEMKKVLAAQYQAGIGQKDPLDWVQAQLQHDQQLLVEVKTQATKTQNALAALLGTTAAHLSILPESLPLPQLTDLQGINTDMLGQRAEVRAARWRVESYLQSIKSAKAAFYPTVSLAAFAGFNALHLADWFRQNAHQTLITPALSLPIFHAGELRANLRGKTAQYDEAVERYNQILLAAVQDAADRYADLQSAEQQVTHQTYALAFARSAANISADRYRVGILPKLNNLDTTLKLLQAKRQFNAAKHQRLQSELAMIQALGEEEAGQVYQNNTSVEKQ